MLNVAVALNQETAAFNLHNTKDKTMSILPPSLRTLGKKMPVFPMGAPPLFIRDQARYVKVDPTEMLWVEAEDNHAVIQCGKKSYTLSTPLKTLEDRLQSYGMQRVHRSFLVNLNSIEAIEDSFVVVKGRGIPIGRKYRAALMNCLRLL